MRTESSGPLVGGIRSRPRDVEISASAVRELPFYPLLRQLSAHWEQAFALISHSTAAEPYVRYPIDVATMKERVREVEAAEHRSLAASFAKRAADTVPIRELWVQQGEQETAITVITDDTTLEDELRLEAIFAAVLEHFPRRFNGYLRIYSEAEGIPAHARSGDRLLP